MAAKRFQTLYFEVSGKQNSLFPLGPVIKCLMYSDRDIIPQFLPAFVSFAAIVEGKVLMYMYPRCQRFYFSFVRSD